MRDLCHRAMFSRHDTLFVGSQLCIRASLCVQAQLTLPVMAVQLGKVALELPDHLDFIAATASSSSEEVCAQVDFRVRNNLLAAAYSR